MAPPVLGSPVLVLVEGTEFDVESIPLPCGFVSVLLLLGIQYTFDASQRRTVHG